MNHRVEPLGHSTASTLIV